MMRVSLRDGKWAALTVLWISDLGILVCRRHHDWPFLLAPQVQNTQEDQLEDPLWCFKLCFVLELQEGATLWEEIQKTYVNLATSFCPNDMEQLHLLADATSVLNYGRKSYCQQLQLIQMQELVFITLEKDKQKKEHINPISNHCWLPGLFINTTLSWCIVVTLGAPEHNQGAASGSKNQRMALLWLVTVSKNTKMWPLYPHVGFEVCLF